MDTRIRRCTEERGSALILAVIAMLLLGVFTLSFAVLADLEVRLGINQKEAQQALLLAEAGLEHGKNILAAAVTAGSFTNFIDTSSKRQLGVPGGGIGAGPGKYWIRVDNDCNGTQDNGELAGGNPLTPALVPAGGEDNRPVACAPATDQNETVVLTAWAETNNGRGRARVRAHYTVGNPWKHSCYDGDTTQLCIEDAVGGCNNNPCVDPSDPRHPNGPAGGALPVPTGIRCGIGGGATEIPASKVPADVLAAAAAAGYGGASFPCVIYEYYLWALHQPAPTRTKCPLITAAGGGYGADPCSVTTGTLAWDPLDATCIATPQKCHGMVFFGPGNNAGNLVTGADVSFGTAGGDWAGCMGTTTDPRNDMRDPSSPAPPCPGAANSSVTVYVMGKVTIKNNVGINGMVVLHGNGGPGGGGNKDFGLTGTNRVKTFPCTGVPVGSNAPGCGYPLAILAYDPPANDTDDSPGPPTASQSIQLDLSNSTSLVSGIIYSGGTADFSPLTVDGGLVAYDVNITNTASRITYNSTYGDAAPPPFFTIPPATGGVVMIPSTWVHCTSYGTNATTLYNGPTGCQ